MRGEPVWLTHGKVRLALHALRPPRDEGDSSARPLLLLHGLGEATPRTLDDVFDAWPGAIHGLDFTGHGESAVPRGGGFTAEILMGDADAALGFLGPLTLCGRGLGAYVGLLLAGARARDVHGVILCDGPGLAGGGPQPSSPRIVHADPAQEGAPDAFALAELSEDLRPTDYALAFARQAFELSPADRAITVCARNRPSWLTAVADVAESDGAILAEALADYASASDSTDRSPASVDG